MSGLLAGHEPWVRLAAFLAVFVAVAAWEVVAPRRRPRFGRARRWLANLGLSALDTALVRLLSPAAAVGAAAFAAERGLGLFQQGAVPYPLAFLASLLVLDLAVWLQHVVLHAVPLLWRLHLVHHSDQDFDLTTGLRFHPLEIALSLAWKMAVVLALGAPVAAVLAFEVLLNATSLFNHGNVRMAPGLDRALRLVLVTPDMHRVHHSVLPRETNSNYGFNLPWWDRLLGTYREAPEAGHDTMVIGLAEIQPASAPGLGELLVLPFRGTSRRHEDR